MTLSRIPAALMLGCMLSALPLAARAQMPLLVDPDAKPADPSIKVPDFDVSSVKPNKSGTNMMRIAFKPDSFSASNLDLMTLICNAYHVRQDQVSGGPSWVRSEHFDVDAKVLGENVEAVKKVPPLKRQVMLQHLLQDRFKLAVHTERKVQPAYELVVAKGGVKMTPAPAGEEDEKGFNPNADPKARHPGMMLVNNGAMEGTGLGLAQIAANLALNLERTVIDKTGLTGKYDFKLNYTEENGKESAASDRPDIFTAVQEQMGLKLVPVKAPGEVLVIDHVEEPTEN